ncbi:Bax inhibitor-1/YccA family protein [Bifidobacterium apri]|uniref:Inhibitor of apoptosis-promoting Bax1 n=1 Tax=Bifidobacterium apri TaxID=1769423 RepID=A0A6A2VAJ9_9BIFI|nr:Bax inhibitor-1/YccA family protein [Bifidobacterium apri]KAB8301779.1 Inhibitor of apoptosis-promoting Bax1 [Bifidobacterium apri]
MTYDQQHQNPSSQSPQYQYNGQAQSEYSQPQYGQPTAQPQVAYPYYQSPAGAGAGTAYAAPASAIPAQVASATERAERTSITRAYAEMTAGLAITAVVAVLTQTFGLLNSFLAATGSLGWIGLMLVQIIMAIAIGNQAMSLKAGAARVLFYLYAALMGFTLSSIFMVYDLGSIGTVLALCTGFFFVLTMLSLTMRSSLLKAGPILLAALIALIVGELIIMLVAPGSTGIMVISAIGVLIFAGLTMYDAQKTRVLFAQYAGQPEAIKSLSIVCALNLYLDFVNMFLYLLRLFGSRD